MSSFSKQPLRTVLCQALFKVLRPQRGTAQTQSWPSPSPGPGKGGRQGTCKCPTMPSWEEGTGALALSTPRSPRGTLVTALRECDKAAVAHSALRSASRALAKHLIPC